MRGGRVRLRRICEREGIESVLTELTSAFVQVRSYSASFPPCLTSNVPEDQRGSRHRARQARPGRMLAAAAPPPGKGLTLPRGNVCRPRGKVAETGGRGYAFLLAVKASCDAVS